MSLIGLHRLSEHLVASVVPVSSAPVTLSQADERLVVGATQRRRAQFAAGREAARQAMAELGVAVVGIGQGPGGEPLFPPELRGSISHTREHAVALVGHASCYRSVGVDIDDARPLGDAAASGVTWQSEVARIQRVVELEDPALAQNFAFSAKEAIFKCQYPLTLNSKLGPLQARLLANPSEAGAFTVAGWRVSAATADVLARITVRLLALDAQTIVLALLPAELA